MADRREYYKEYYFKNKELIKKVRQKYFQKHKQEFYDREKKRKEKLRCDIQKNKIQTR